MSDKRKEEGDSSVLERQKVDEPRKYKVLLLNDHYTTMEFVVMVLRTVFHHSSAQATRVMLHIHNNGVGVAGVYTREVAETRIAQVEAMAAEEGHPLQCEMEPE
ncbi:MAG: ATP-dependent Clp protease adapter ClpS [Alphaproteobacteria bacterium]|nr:ATP-dependent Clp protease adapter ClpS [Alphaproteobacteria bacterium]